MAKQNYRQAKRHKELARKARQEQKMLRRSSRSPSADQIAETADSAQQDAAADAGHVEQPSSTPDA